MVGKMKESFNIATPYEFLSMSVIGIGLIITYWVSWLGWLLVLIGMLAGFILFRVLRLITQKRVFSMSDREMQIIDHIRQKW